MSGSESVIVLRRQAADAAMRARPNDRATRPARGRPARRPGTLRAVRPNAGVEAAYRVRLRAMIAAMNKDVIAELRQAYGLNEPAIARDALPAEELADVVRRLSDRWLRAFDDGARELAEYFALEASERSDFALQAALKRAGFSIEFQMTPGARDVLRATIEQQVGLIRSIPRQYLTNVQGAVMRSVQIGRDLGALSRELQAEYGVTKRRAAFIARDQNNKATAAMTRGRQVELELFKARWRHSHAGKKPRPTHVRMDGKVYDVRKGMYDSAVKRYVLPGEEPNCRCYSEPVVPGFG